MLSQKVSIVEHFLILLLPSFFLNLFSRINYNFQSWSFIVRFVRLLFTHFLFNIRQLSDNFILFLLTQAQQSSQFLFTAEKP